MDGFRTMRLISDIDSNIRLLLISVEKELIQQINTKSGIK